MSCGRFFILFGAFFFFLQEYIQSCLLFLHELQILKSAVPIKGEL